MKVFEAINEADALKPNMYGMQVKIKWLSRLDKRIFEQIILTHRLSEEEKAPFLPQDDGGETGSETGTGDAGTGDTETGSTETPETESGWRRLDITGMPPEEDDGQLVFNGYTNEDEQAELLVGEPYDSMYVHWLAAMIDWNNREYDSYNNENAMFEAEYGAFRNAFNRTHMPKQTRKIYF